MGIAKNAFNPLTSDKLDTSGMDYIALGHFHSRFEAEGKTRTAFNPGSPEPLGFDEEGSHGVYLAEIIVEDSGRKRSEVRFVPISRRTYRNVAVHCENYGSDEKIAAAAADAMREAGSSEDLYSITLKGTVEAGYKADIRRLEASLAPECFFIRIRDNTVPGYDLKN
jgi:DNA repair exonuclease